MPNIGPLELVIVLVIALVVLGPKRLPGLGKQLGDGMRDFKDALTENHDKDDDDEGGDDDAAAGRPALTQSTPTATGDATRTGSAERTGQDA